MKTLVNKISDLIEARKNALIYGKSLDFHEYSTQIEELENYLPSGGGLDEGCTIDLQNSTTNRIVINCSFHCMDEFGYYDDWQSYNVIVTPTFNGSISIEVKGKERRKYQIKDYLCELFYDYLCELFYDCLMRQIQ